MPAGLPTRPGAVVFDLDGTLVDSLGDIADAANAMLDQLGHASHPVRAYRQFVGDGVQLLVERCLPTDVAASEQQLRHALEMYRQQYQRRWHNRTTPYPGIPEALQALVNAEIPLAVLSNKPHEFTTCCVDHFFPEIPFSVIQGQQETIDKKPAPDGALLIAEKMAIDPGCCALVGDSDVDMLTATNAGMRGVGVLWGFRDENELQAAGATTIVASTDRLVSSLGI